LTHSEFMLYVPGPGLAASTKSKRFDLLVSALPPCQLHSITSHVSASKQLVHEREVKIHVM